MDKMNSLPTREQLEKEYGQVWTRDELLEEFVVLNFCAGFVTVKRNSDNVRGTMDYRDVAPRLYFDFVETIRR